MKPHTNVVSTRLIDEHYEAISAMAKENNVTKCELIRSIIKHKIKKQKNEDETIYPDTSR